jgi:NADH:ubiquinone oxidoreductase subunit 2 (subunit N)
VIGLFYYLRVIVVMLQSPESDAEAVVTLPCRSPNLAGSALLLACSLGVMAMGVFPGILTQLLRNISRLAG